LSGYSGVFTIMPYSKAHCKSVGQARVLPYGRT